MTELWGKVKISHRCLGKASESGVKTRQGGLWGELPGREMGNPRGQRCGGRGWGHPERASSRQQNMKENRRPKGS